MFLGTLPSFIRLQAPQMHRFLKIKFLLITLNRPPAFPQILNTLCIGLHCRQSDGSASHANARKSQRLSPFQERSRHYHQVKAACMVVSQKRWIDSYYVTQEQYCSVRFCFRSSAFFAYEKLF